MQASKVRLDHVSAFLKQHFDDADDFAHGSSNA
jgi:hypothetical protein